VLARLNLASDPFRNRALPWTVAVVVSAVSLLALAYVLSEYRRASAETALADRQVRELNARRAELDRQAAEIKQTIPPEQQETLKAAHSLVDLKSFSWSRLFVDLEEVLPSSVRVSRINVRDVTRAGDLTRADLDLTVVGRAPTDVTGMIDEMNRVGTFTAIPVSENQKSGRGESGYEWILRVTYTQRSRAARPAEEGGREAGAARAASNGAGGLE
jgi:Tfp pilus assembly protein PilN